MGSCCGPGEKHRGKALLNLAVFCPACSGDLDSPKDLALALAAALQGAVLALSP